MNHGRRKLFRGAAIVTLGHGLSQLCGFLRNIVVARFLLPADFGIAAMLATTVSVMEMIGAFGLEDLMIAAKPQDVDRLQATAHRLNLIRSAVACVVVAVAASPISILFGAPEAAWAFRWLGVILLCRGMFHLDMHRLKRELNYLPEVKAGLVGNVTALVLAFPIAYATRDFSAMLWLLMIRTVVDIGASHWFAEKPYRLEWDAQAAEKAWRFGWPLQLNAILVFCLFQGDRLIMASAPQLSSGVTITLADLGVFSAAFSVAVAPMILLAKVSASLLLPLFAQKREDMVQTKRLYSQSAEIISLISGIMAMTCILLGEPLMRLLYGAKYSGGGIVLAWLGASQAVRLLRGPPSGISTAHHDTKNSLFSNVFRVIGLGFVWFVVTQGYSLPWVAMIAFLSEFAAFLFSIFRVQAINGIEARRCLWPLTFPSLGCFVAALVVEHWKVTDLAWLISGWVILVPVVGFLMVVSSAGLREITVFMYSKFRSTSWRGMAAVLRGNRATP